MKPPIRHVTVRLGITANGAIRTRAVTYWQKPITESEIERAGARATPWTSALTG